MTLEEFYAWDSGDELRYELIDGVPVALPLPRNAHGKILSALARYIVDALDGPLKGTACIRAGILSPSRSNSFYQADLAVSCKPQLDDRHEMSEPLLIVEVLSPSTEDKDRKIKLVDYRKIPSVQEVLMVDCTRRYCELHRRLDDDRWLTELLVDLNATVTLESIGAVLTLSDIYANISFV
jgi:Uma2 family endonuclease